MRRLYRTLTVDNADVLDGTPLSTILPNKRVVLYIASTQLDTLLTLNPPAGVAEAVTERLPQRTNGQPLVSDDLAYDVPIPTGGHPIINVDIQTAATVGLLVLEMP